MDGSQMKYQFGAIEGLASGIGGKVSSIEGILGDLGGQINQLQSTWQGSANEGFVQTKTQWFQASDDLTRVLKQIQIAVQQTVQDAQHTEQTNAARWQ